MAVGVDLTITLAILLIWYALISEGLWGSALMTFNVLFSILIAMNFYEPLARLLVTNASFMGNYADSLCLLGLFLVSLVVLRIVTESLAPSMVRFPTPVFHLGRVAFGLAGAILTVAFVLLVFHASPVHKKIFGVIDYETMPPFKQGLDRKLLAFFQYTTAYPFARYGSDESDPFDEFGDARAFDPRGSWLIDHQNARIGEGTVPPEEEASSSGGEGGGAAGAGAGGQAPPG